MEHTLLMITVGDLRTNTKLLLETTYFIFRDTVHKKSDGQRRLPMCIASENYPIFRGRSLCDPSPKTEAQCPYKQNYLPLISYLSHRLSSSKSLFSCPTLKPFSLLPIDALYLSYKCRKFTFDGKSQFGVIGLFLSLQSDFK